MRTTSVEVEPQGRAPALSFVAREEVATTSETGRLEMRKITGVAMVILLAMFLQTFLLGFIERHTDETANLLAKAKNMLRPDPLQKPATNTTTHFAQVITDADEAATDDATSKAEMLGCGTPVLFDDRNPLAFQKDFTPFKSNFMWMWLANDNSGDAYLELNKTSISKGNALEIGIDALLMDGEYSHYQLSSAFSTWVWMMRLAEDGKGVDYVLHDLSERPPEDKNYEQLWEAHHQSGTFVTLPKVGFRLKKNCNGEATVFVEASFLVNYGFFGLYDPYYWETMSSKAANRSRVAKAGRARRASAPSAGKHQQKQQQTRQVEAKQYGENVDLRTVKAFSHNIDYSIDDIRFCIFELPKDKMRPRLGDERAGYFLQEWKMLGDYSQEHWSKEREDLRIDPMIRFISKMRFPNRFTGRNEIHYYVDPTVPQPFWEATRLGIQGWQRGFDDIAEYFDANDPPRIIAHTPADADWPKDYDVADVRFNSVSWATGQGMVFSIGLSVNDPRTGEILKANIMFTLGWLESYLGQDILYGAFQGDGVIQKDARFAKEARRWGSAKAKTEGLDEMTEALFGPMDAMRKGFKEQTLDTAQGWALNAGFQERMRSMAVKTWKVASKPSNAQAKQFLQAAIQDITTHEVGHTLGLRHNFKGSLGITLAQAQNRTHTLEHGLTASVMDYVPPFFVSQAVKDQLGVPGEEHEFIFTPVVGDYDRFVIKYGYAKLEEEEQCEKEWCPKSSQLKALADKYDEQDVWSFGSDEMVDMIYTAPYDATSDPIGWYTSQYSLVREAMDKLFERNMRDREAWWELTVDMRQLLISAAMSGASMGRFIGGYNLRRKRGLDCVKNGVPTNCDKSSIEPTTVADQQRALDGMLELIKNVDSWVPEWLKEEAVMPSWGFYDQKAFFTPYFLDRVKGFILFNIVNPANLEMLLWTELHGMPKNRINGWLLPTISKALLGMDAHTVDPQAVRRALQVKSVNNVQAEYFLLIQMCLFYVEDTIIDAALIAEILRIDDAISAVRKLINQEAHPDPMELAFLDVLTESH